MVLPDRLEEPGSIAVRDGVIVDAGSSSAGAGDLPQVSGVGMVAVGGFFDVHVHGADGWQVNGDSAAEVAVAVEHVARFHARHGTTSLLATTVSDSFERLEATIAGVAEVMRRGVEAGATVRGVHLEGPWIARAKMGAQDPAALRPPEPAELRRLCDVAPGVVRMVTLAPELPGAADLASVALSCGAVVALGHSDASYEVARAAIEGGARHATHLFNAMAPLHHRRPGLVAAALLDDRVTVELIADGEHLHPAILELVARLAPGRIVLVSDAVPAAGLEPGRYQLGRLDLEVSGRRVTLAGDPATLAGSVLTMDRALRSLVEAGVPLAAAAAAASSTPARAAGLAGLGLGRLEPGAPADLVLLGGDGTAVATVIDGCPVYDPLGLFAPAMAALR